MVWLQLFHCKPGNSCITTSSLSLTLMCVWFPVQGRRCDTVPQLCRHVGLILAVESLLYSQRKLSGCQSADGESRRSNGQGTFACVLARINGAASWEVVGRWEGGQTGVPKLEGSRRGRRLEMSSRVQGRVVFQGTHKPLGQQQDWLDVGVIQQGVGTWKGSGRSQVQAPFLYGSPLALGLGLGLGLILVPPSCLGCCSWFLLQSHHLCRLHHTHTLPAMSL